jgi:hypothetical protein
MHCPSHTSGRVASSRHVAHRARAHGSDDRFSFWFIALIAADRDLLAIRFMTGLTLGIALGARKQRNSSTWRALDQGD